MDYGQNSETIPTAKGQGFSPAAFGISTGLAIVLAIVGLVLLILYIRRDATLVKASLCPEKVSGLVVKPNEKVATVATSCGTQSNCTYTVTSLQSAVEICSNLGPSKCQAFTLRQLNNNNNFTLTISDSTLTVADIGSDTYRLIV